MGIQIFLSQVSDAVHDIIEHNFDSKISYGDKAT